MAALCVITMANVVVRYLSDESFAWTEELSVFLLVLTTMAGTAAAALRDNHIRIEFFLERGSAAHRRRLVVAHEAVRVAGFGAEIAATVAEELGVPVRRVGGARIPAGYSKRLEDEASIDAAAILKALANF